MTWPGCKDGVDIIECVDNGDHDTNRPWMYEVVWNWMQSNPRQAAPPGAMVSVDNLGVGQLATMHFTGGTPDSPAALAYSTQGIGSTHVSQANVRHLA